MYVVLVPCTVLKQPSLFKITPGRPCHCSSVQAYATCNKLSIQLVPVWSVNNDLSLRLLLLLLHDGQGFCLRLQRENVGESSSPRNYPYQVFFPIFFYKYF
jgi:hypothetical protein